MGACSGVFYAVDRRSGQIIWSYNIKQDGNQSSFHGDILLVGDQVLVGTDRGTDTAGQGHVYAFDRFSGKMLWKQLAAPGVSTDLLLDGQQVIAYAASGELVSLDLRSGKPAWKTKITEQSPDRYLPSPALHNHVVFAGTVDGHIVAVRAIDGTVVWEQTIEPASYLQPVVMGNDIYVISAAGYLYRLDGRSGRVLKRITLGARPSFLPAQTSDSIFLQFADHTLKRINANGVVWSQRVSGDLTTHQPLLLHGDVVVADDSGTVMAFRLADGELQWSTVLNHEKAPITTIGADSSLLFVGSQNGTLYGIDLRQLVAQHRKPSESKNSSPR